MAQGPVCSGCQRIITDRFLLRVTDNLWHEQCVRCAECGDELTDSCFLRDQKLYCRRDYAE
uniref:LIM zinc-binding domain-containing protein n=1 Tax=Cynoglossus semilaevis TaxID=244447 RepID=A0A3P8UAK3_CYNSE